jgi:diacylglycerol kinase family enzyme
MWGYARVFMKTVVKRRRFRVSLDEEHMHLYRNVYMLMLANARMYGTGAVVNPTGSMRDGYFEVILLKDFRWWDLPRLFFPRRRPRLEREEVVSVKSISVACNRPVHFQMDGEYRGKVTRLRAAINPQGLRVLVPR